MAARVGSVVVLVAAWQIVAMIASAKTLPPPWDVLAAIAAEARSGDLLVNIGVTLWRVLSSFLIAMGTGCVAGVALGRSPAADRAINSWLILLLNTPALVIAVLCYLWLGLTEAAAITAVVLNKFPNVVVIVREGARSLDPALDEMSEVYRFSFGAWARHVLLPQLAPYVAAAARSGLSLVWKIVLVVELLGRPNGVGYAISYSFQLFDVRTILAYSFAFSAIIFAIDAFVLRPVETHARRWRSASA